MSPRENKLAIKSKNGALAFQQSLYPPSEIIDTFEKHHNGAAQEILQMCRDEQQHSHNIDAKVH